MFMVKKIITNDNGKIDHSITDPLTLNGNYV